MPSSSAFVVFFALLSSALAADILLQNTDDGSQFADSYGVNTCDEYQIDCEDDTCTAVSTFFACTDGVNAVHTSYSDGDCTTSSESQSYTLPYERDGGSDDHIHYTYTMVSADVDGGVVIWDYGAAGCASDQAKGSKKWVTGYCMTAGSQFNNITETWITIMSPPSDVASYKIEADADLATVYWYSDSACSTAATTPSSAMATSECQQGGIDDESDTVYRKIVAYIPASELATTMASTSGGSTLMPSLVLAVVAGVLNAARF